MTRALRIVTVGVVAAAAVLIGSPAAAHVEVAEARPNGDGTTAVTFGFDHSCDTSPTTELVVGLPAGVTATATTQPRGWSATIAADRVTWTGSGLETGQMTVVTRITATAGQSLRFPALQRCADGGSYDWIDTTPDGDEPAPRLIATSAMLAAQPARATVAAAGEGEGGGASLPQALAALAAFVALAAAAGLVLARRMAVNNLSGRDN
jgi:periplasmic copper chaperone A